MGKDLNSEVDLTTEAKIKVAALKVFTEKGYSATRTRDIAEEAGLNLALLNYYFRSKERLFKLVINERINEMFGVLEPIMNNAENDLENKIKDIITFYMEMLPLNPDLPLFILNEVKNNEHSFEFNVPLQKIFEESVFTHQLKKRKPNEHPFQFIFNLMALCVFPFMAQPFLRKINMPLEGDLNQIMIDRKQLIFTWIIGLLNLEEPIPDSSKMESFSQSCSLNNSKV